MKKSDFPPVLKALGMAGPATACLTIVGVYFEVNYGSSPRGIVFTRT
jgi:hypothetical protein